MTHSIERVGPDEVDVRIDKPDRGVTLHFRKVEGGKVWKVGSTLHYGESTFVPREDFNRAVSLARKVLAGTAEELRGQTDEQVARHILELARRRNYSVEVAVQVFFDTAKWCSRYRIPDVMSEIGKIGGMASKLQALRRSLDAEKKKRQPKLL